MANPTTADELAQRCLDVGIVDERQLQQVWSDLGAGATSLNEMQQALLRSGAVTNYQIDRILNGYRAGFFYGDYKIQYLVGTGTFARVFRAAHRVTNQLYAVKVLRNRFSDNPKEAELFRREGELGSSLQHPNIVPIHQVFSQGLTHFIVMDFIEGRNLREFYKIRGKFDPVEATNIIIDITAGLNYAFQRGVTHRDLKMSNVLVSSEGQGKLVDFGLAGLDNNDEANSVNPRTIDYAGLERATGVRKDDTRSDIFFAGCIYYQMLTGRPPMPETKDRVQRLSKSRYQDIPPILEVETSVPPVLALSVNRAIEFDPDRRYQTPAEMLTDVKLALRRLDKEEEQAQAKRSREQLEGHDQDGKPRRLLVIESDTKMQDVFRDLFKKNGYRVLVTSDPERAWSRFMDDHAAADLVLFSCVNLGKSALDLFNRFGREGLTKDIPAVLLLGEKQRPWEKSADRATHRSVISMPVKSKQLREAMLAVSQSN